MFGSVLQPMHILIILVIALLIFGPKKLPQLGASLGKSLRELRKGLDGTSSSDQQPHPSPNSTETRK